MQFSIRNCKKVSDTDCAGYFFDGICQKTQAQWAAAKLFDAAIEKTGRQAVQIHYSSKVQEKLKGKR